MLTQSTWQYYQRHWKSIQENTQQIVHCPSAFSSATVVFFSVGAESDLLRLFVWRGFLPLLKIIDVNNFELINQTAELLCDVVIESRNWRLIGSTLVPFCLRAMGLCMGLVQSEDLAIYQWRMPTFIQGLESESSEINLDQVAILLDSGSLQLPTVCHILTSVLVAALKSCQMVESAAFVRAEDQHSAEDFTRYVLWALYDMAIHMISQCPEHRSCATHLLLPCIFRALDVVSSFEVPLNGSTHQKGCFGMKYEEDWYSLGSSPYALVRKQSLHILKLSLGHNSSRFQSGGSQWHHVVSRANGHDDKQSSTTHGMTKREKWAEKEAKSLGVGQMFNASEPCLNAQQRWEAFVLLYEMLEEYGAHLVEAAWSHQVSLLLRFSGTLDPKMDHVDRYCGSEDFVMTIRKSFLGINWENNDNYAKFVPESFIVGAFIQGLNDPIHHKDFG
ncbi:hypothetical protein ACLOJK_033832 [Asimina triloba]